MTRSHPIVRARCRALRIAGFGVAGLRTLRIAAKATF